jgi:hypothetical protein
MPVFDILCLANSNKMRGSCVAGLRGDNPLSHPDTVKALRAAAAALGSGLPPKRPHELPHNAGKAWDAAEEETLVREFEGGETMAAIARAHGRTPGAIKSRLICLGKIDD